MSPAERMIQVIVEARQYRNGGERGSHFMLDSQRSNYRDQKNPAIVTAESWRLSHLDYLYPQTTPVVIKLDHKKIAQVTKSPTINSSKGIERKGRMAITTDRCRAGILDGHRDWLLRRL